MMWQKTLREKVCFRGVGLHCGQEIRIELLPAPAQHGIIFMRTDKPGHQEIKATADYVADTTLATTLGAGVNGSRVTVGTVEHLLAALAGLGIDNALVHIDGPEVPVLDGSARGWIDLIQQAGVETQSVPKKYLVIKKEIKVMDGDRSASFSPASSFKINCTIDFDHPLIPNKPFEFDFSERDFVRDVASARTFGFLRDVEMLKSKGLARGGSLENAVVIDHLRILNPEGLRFSDEFVRHKVLDAIGDVSLFGMPVKGRLKLVRSGHSLNTALVQKILANPKAFEVIEHRVAEARESDAAPVSFEAAETAY